MDIMVTSSLVIITAIFMTILNQRFFRLPTTIAVMVAALVLSLLTMLLAKFYWTDLDVQLNALLQNIDFASLLLNGMLGYLLFAGALSINHEDFMSAFKEILTLATVSTLISTLLITVLIYLMLAMISHLLSIPMPLGWIGCMLFAALISPTDPIAVLGTLKTMQAPRSISIKMAGESLFNDGIGIVIFITIYQVAFGVHQSPTVLSVIGLFVQQALGGLIYGAALGLIMQQMIRYTYGIKLHILITIAMVTAGYTLARFLGVSGPLAMVVSGMVINFNHKFFQLPEQSKLALHQFWEIIDELLNIVLFFLIGAEILIVEQSMMSFLIMLFTIPLVLLARWISIYIPMHGLGLFSRQTPHTIEVLVWGGLRGGLAVALALSLPDTPDRQIILILTYAVVVFSILVQGTTIPKLVLKRFASEHGQN